MMPVAWADLLAILNGIAAQRHSGAVAVAVLDLILSQALLHHLNHVSLWKEHVIAFFNVLFRERLRSLQCLFRGQILIRQTVLLWHLW